MEYNIYMTPELRREVKRDLRVKEKANAEIKDSLSFERTTIANERTFLAYSRTALSLVIAGFSLHEFFGSTVSMWLGSVIIPLGIGIGFTGYRKYVRRKELIQRKKDAYVPAKQMLALLKVEKGEELNQRQSQIAS